MKVCDHRCLFDFKYWKKFFSGLVGAVSNIKQTSIMGYHRFFKQCKVTRMNQPNYTKVPKSTDTRFSCQEISNRNQLAQKSQDQIILKF